MEDEKIIDLYWERKDEAITETQAAYGRQLQTIAQRIVQSYEDAEESVNDTYLDAWHNMPPHRPSILSTFLGKITRRVSIDKWRGRTADKRGGSEIVLALDELAECVPSDHSVEREVEAATLETIINDFVMSLPLMERRVFICRYWYLDPISAIAEQFGFSQSKVKMILHRQRHRLRSILEREAFL